jgi:hypothetical protein
LTDERRAALGAEWDLLELLCRGVRTGEEEAEVRRLVKSGPHWGTVLEHALRHRMLSMLAFELDRLGVLDATPLRVSEHLLSVLAHNRYRRQIWYAELGRVTGALAAVEVPTTVRKGGAYESSIYGGNGSRWLGDIDLLVSPADAETAARTLADLGYESGLYDFGTDRVRPFDRAELIRYRLSPDHLPTSSLRTGDPLVPVLEVDCAMSLTWSRGPYHVPVQDVLASREAFVVDGPPPVVALRAAPVFQFLDTVLHLFREAWFEWWLDKEQDVDLMKFGDVLRLYRAYEDEFANDRLQNLITSYGVVEPVAWVLEHLDRTFGTGSVARLGLEGHTTEAFLASAAATGPETAVWNADMRARLHSTNRRGLQAGR